MSTCELEAGLQSRLEAPLHDDAGMWIYRFRRRHFVVGAGLCLLAALQYFVIAPRLERLPADYVAETKFAAKCRSHQTPTSPVEEFDTIVRRRDQTLISGPDHSIIQGDTHWVTPSGVVMFEVLSVYGVDRRTRENLPSYGNEDRSGLYLFPPHTRQQTYGQWDPMYAGPRVATFDRTEQRDGLPVYVFNFVAEGIDETSGYSSLPDVPERYRAITFGKGTLRVEPISGVIVGSEEEGTSYFVDPKTGAHVAEIFQWSDRFTPETQAAQWQLARAQRWHFLALEIYLPAALVIAGLTWLAGAALLFRRQKRPLAPESASLRGSLFLPSRQSL
ncbi:MAG: porin PorA family protein [Chthoniobacterales bacterium]